VKENQSRMVLLVDPTGTCRFCNVKRSLLPISIRSKHSFKEPASVAFMISLQVMLWRSVIIPEMVWC